MEKMKLETVDICKKNLQALNDLFPNCFIESKSEDGKVSKKLNIEMLKQVLGEKVTDSTETYDFTWIGKRNSIVEANKPTRNTLRPWIEDSKKWETTENLYIEGDNLEVLKLLQESYLESIKMIYIDPPYNTGSDSFVYPDNYTMDEEEFQEQIELRDDNGNKLFRENNAANPRFHSDWCSMMYSRLLLARNLLSTDGVLVMSISDAEFHNLKKIADEIFGADNYCGDIIWNSTKSVTNTALISVSHTYNLIYFKNMNYFVANRTEFRVADDGEGFKNPDNDPRGSWKADPFQVGGWRPNQQYEIVNPKTGIVYYPNTGCSWKNDYNKYKELLADNRIVFGKNGDGGPQRKRFIWEAQERGKVVKTIWDDVETTTNGTQLLKKMFDGVSIFSNPKPVGFIYKLLQLGMNTDGICLDFFSGSATTAHALMKLNAADGGKRKFIMVQMQEECPKKSEAHNAGYSNICEIGKERIRRASDYIKKENPDAVFDDGFRVLKVADSNMKDVYFSPAETEQTLLTMLESNIKSDRTDLDLLFGCLLEWGLPLSLPYSSEQIEGCTVHNYNDGDLIACFDENIPESVIKEIAKQQPLRAVFRDSCFKNSPAKINVGEIFKLMAPDTSIKVI